MRTIPFTVVVGYLGAGKTTLLNHLLRHNAGRSIALLLNDFGSISIDADLRAPLAARSTLSTVVSVVV